MRAFTALNLALLLSGVCVVAEAGIYLGTDNAVPTSVAPTSAVVVAVPANIELQPATGHYKPPQTTKETFTAPVPTSTSSAKNTIQPITTSVTTITSVTSVAPKPVVTSSATSVPAKSVVTSSTVSVTSVASKSTAPTSPNLQPVTGHYRPLQAKKELLPPPLVSDVGMVAVVTPSIPSPDAHLSPEPKAPKFDEGIVTVTPVLPVKDLAAPMPVPCTANGKGLCEPPLPVAAYPVPVADPYPIYDGLIVRLHSGSLRENVIHIVEKSRWGHVVWTLPFDYKWIGDITLKGPDVQDILAQLLRPYPVQAVFYDKNHVVAIVARRPQL
jgi:hypothetical protein